MFSGLIHREASISSGEDAAVAAGAAPPHGGPSLVLTADPKPRLRWTADLHERFVDAVAQLGGPERVAVLIAAAFFGYMLALLQRRVGGIVSSEDGPQTLIQESMPPYQKPMNLSVRPSLIPTNDDGSEKLEHEEGFFSLMGKLLGGAKSSATEIFLLSIQN